MVDAIKSGRPEDATPAVKLTEKKRGRAGPGRPKGSPNKATKDVRALASQYGGDAIDELFRLAKKAKSEQARVAACKEILDRAYGKSPQAITGDGGGPVKLSIEWLAPAA